IVGQGYTCKINVTLTNQGDFTESFNVALYANATLIGTSSINSLTEKTSTVATFIWNTTGFAKGNYTISAYAWPVSGETETADNRLNDIYIFVTLPGDINGDKKVDILDAIKLANAFGSKLGDPSWNPNADINDDHRVNILDAIILSNHFGERDP
ncbi:MAG: dockerin type I domain-containing protein, partial [Candidatus Bathyarchaeia archaeon]